jgi:hypothetical protein
LKTLLPNDLPQRVDFLLELQPQADTPPRLTRIARLGSNGTRDLWWQNTTGTKIASSEVESTLNQLTQTPQNDAISADNPSYSLLLFQDGRAVMERPGQPAVSRLANAYAIAAKAAEHLAAASLDEWGFHLPDGSDMHVFQGESAASGPVYLIENLTETLIPLAEHIAQEMINNRHHTALIGPRSLYRALLVQGIRRALQQQSAVLLDTDQILRLGLHHPGPACFCCEVNSANWPTLKHLIETKTILVLAEVSHRQSAQPHQAFSDRTNGGDIRLFEQIWTIERLSQRRCQITNRS